MINCETSLWQFGSFHINIFIYLLYVYKCVYTFILHVYLYKSSFLQPYSGGILEFERPCDRL